MKPISIRNSLIRNWISLLLVSSLCIFSAVYFISRSIVRDLAGTVIERVSVQIEKELSAFVKPIRRNTLIAKSWGEAGRLDISNPDALIELFTPIILNTPHVTSMMVADTNGREWMLLRQEGGWLSRLTDPTRWEGKSSIRRWKDGESRGDSVLEQLNYDPRLRPWFQGAMATSEKGRIHWTEPYTFFTTKEPGITASTRWAHPGDLRESQVVGFDVKLIDLSRFTYQLDVSDNGVAFILGSNETLLGLPGVAEFSDLEVRGEALLKKVSDSNVPLLFDARKAFNSVNEDDRSAFRFDSGGERWWGGLREFSSGGITDIQIGVLLPLADMAGSVLQLQWILFGVCLATAIIAVVIANRLSNSYSQPLEQLAAQSARIRNLDFTESKPIDSELREIRNLAEAQDNTVTVLQSFSRYVPVDLVRELLQRGHVAQIGGRTESMSVLFTDIKGFTSIVESMPPDDLADQMSIYFEAMLGCLGEGHATIDKLIGDGIMAFWGAPEPNFDHVRDAVGSVIACQKMLAKLNENWKREGKPCLETCFGLSTGDVVVGNVGSPSRLNYTVLGDVVNVASRLEGLNRKYGTCALATEAVVEAAGPEFRWRSIDEVTVKGKSRAVRVFELLGKKEQADAELPREPA